MYIQILYSISLCTYKHYILYINSILCACCCCAVPLFFRFVLFIILFIYWLISTTHPSLYMYNILPVSLKAVLSPSLYIAISLFLSLSSAHYLCLSLSLSLPQFPSLVLVASLGALSLSWVLRYFEMFSKHLYNNFRCHFHNKNIL